MVRFHLFGVVLALFAASAGHAADPSKRKTDVTMAADQFLINGKPTYAGRTWNGRKIE